MENDISCCIKFLTVIAGRKRKELLRDAIFANGGRLLNLVYGKGSVPASYIQEMLGLVFLLHFTAFRTAQDWCLVRPQWTDAALPFGLCGFDDFFQHPQPVAVSDGRDGLWSIDSDRGSGRITWGLRLLTVRIDQLWYCVGFWDERFSLDSCMG